MVSGASPRFLTRADPPRWCPFPFPPFPFLSSGSSRSARPRSRRPRSGRPRRSGSEGPWQSSARLRPRRENSSNGPLPMKPRTLSPPPRPTSSVGHGKRCVCFLLRVYPHHTHTRTHQRQHHHSAVHESCNVAKSRFVFFRLTAYHLFSSLFAGPCGGQPAPRRAPGPARCLVRQPGRRG